MWLQRGSEATITDTGEVCGPGVSPGHLALLTFCCGNTKRGRAAESILSVLWAQQVGGWLEGCRGNGRLGVLTHVPRADGVTGTKRSLFSDGPPNV